MMPNTPLINDDPIDVIQQEAAAVAACFGVPAPADMAAALVERLTMRFAGCDLYVPRMPRRARTMRDREIRRKWSGANAAELALEYDLSERQVRRIALQRQIIDIFP
jgi:Mor family transcriptional regulator